MALPNKWGEKKEFEMAAVQFRKMTRWTKFCAVIGYPCGQDGAILPVRGYTLSPAKKFPQEPYTIKILYWPSLLARGGWILASFLFVFLDLVSISINEDSNKIVANIQPSWPIFLSLKERSHTKTSQYIPLNQLVYLFYKRASYVLPNKKYNNFRLWL